MTTANDIVGARLDARSGRDGRPLEAFALDRRRVKGRRTREAILAAAVDLASVDGLEGLTIGRLATELGMSKSGLFAHFGSKEELQLATLQAARDIFVAEVVAPAREADRGLPRLQALLEGWLAYMCREVFRGGCFFDAVRAEYDSRPDSPVRETITAQFASWDELLANRVRAAKKAGHLDPDTDPEQLAFELDAIGSAANTRFQFDRDPAAFDRAQRAMRARLQAAAVNPA